MAYQQQTDGDMGFKGFASRLNPIALEPGMLQLSQNCRLERGVIRARKGLDKVQGQPTPTDTLVTSYTYTDNSNIDRLLLVCLDGLYVYTPTQYGLAETLSAKISFPTGRFMSTTTRILTDPSGDFLTTESGSRLIEVEASRAQYDVQGPFPYNGQNHFVIFRGKADETVFDGTFTNPSGTSITVTVTTATAHGFLTGDEVSFYTTHQALLVENYVITVTSPTQFTFAYSGGNATQHNSAACKLQRGKPPLFWDGTSATAAIIPQTVPAFMAGTAGYDAVNYSVPPGDFGLQFQNRLVVAYKRNKLAVSDILEYRTFDLTLNNFTINTGLNDTLVGVLPWVQDQFLVFMQKSIYLCYIETSNFAVGSAPGVNSSITVLTTELGCLARRTIVSAGQFVFFLSNRGINLLTPQLDLKLIGNTKTLSDNIDDWMQRINYTYIANACSAYFNNRLWISLPIDNADSNDHLFVWNMLNEAWESVDTYQSIREGTIMGADELQVLQFNNAKELFVIRKFDESGLPQDENGGVYVTDQEEDGDFVSTTVAASPILPFILPAVLTQGIISPLPIYAAIKTRQYTLNTLQEKFYSNIQVASKASSSKNQIGVSVSTSNQDITQNNGVITFTDATDKTYRDRIGLRGYAIDATLSLQKGQPEVRAITITGSVASRPMISQQ
jgi:hypothetical protein